MRHTRLVTIAAATAVVALALGGAPVSGQAPDPPPITVDPVAGPAGTTITFSGEGCLIDGAPGVVYVFVDLVGGGRSFVLENVSADDEGAWSTRTRFEDLDPVGSYDINARCFDPGPDDGGVDYATASFELTADPEKPELTISIDPSSGPAGTTIAVSGEGCPKSDVYLLLTVPTTLGPLFRIDDGFTAPDAEGAWAGALVVHEDRVDLAMSDPIFGDEYSVVAFCGVSEGERFTPWSESDSIAFELTGEDGGPGIVDDSTAETGAGTTTESPAPIRPLAAPASPVVADPTYTG